jgi:hypothetical protein
MFYFSLSFQNILAIQLSLLSNVHSWLLRRYIGIWHSGRIFDIWIQLLKIPNVSATALRSTSKVKKPWYPQMIEVYSHYLAEISSRGKSLVFNTGPHFRSIRYELHLSAKEASWPFVFITHPEYGTINTKASWSSRPTQNHFVASNSDTGVKLRQKGGQFLFNQQCLRWTEFLNHRISTTLRCSKSSPFLFSPILPSI